MGFSTTTLREVTKTQIQALKIINTGRATNRCIDENPPIIAFVSTIL